MNNKPNFAYGDPDRFWLKFMGLDEKGKYDCTG